MKSNIIPQTSNIAAAPPLLTYPARPVNGGRLESAPPKVGPWICQPKIDDWRAILHAPTGRIWNRHGQPLSIAADIQPAIRFIQSRDYEWLDVGVLERRHEILKGRIVIFDWITPVRGHIERRTCLKCDFDTLPASPRNAGDRLVFLIPEWAGDKIEVSYAALQFINADIKNQLGTAHNFYEGLVCKRTDKPYPVQLLSPNKETPWMIKHRFDQ